MNTQDKVNFIEANSDQYEALYIDVTTYVSVEVASFNKVLHNGNLQFFGWNGNREGVWNVDLTNSDRLDELYKQMVDLVGEQ